MTQNSHTLARIDLRALQPDPDGLLQILERLAEIGFEGFSLLYEDTFPWTVDDRMRAATAFPEDVVAGIAEWCLRRGLVHLVELSAYGLTDCLLSIASFGHLRAAIADEKDGPGYAAAADNMIERIVDDVYTLIPDAGLIFGPSSLSRSTPLLASTTERLMSIAETYSETAGLWGVIAPPAADQAWIHVEPLWDLQTSVEIADYTTCEGYGGTSRLPIAAGISDLAAGLNRRRGHETSVQPDDIEVIFHEFEAAFDTCRDAVCGAERALICVVLESGPRRESAALHAAVRAEAAGTVLDALGRSGEALCAAAPPLVSAPAVSRFVAERTGPLTERRAAVEGRLAVLRQGLVGVGRST